MILRKKMFSQLNSLSPKQVAGTAGFFNVSFYKVKVPLRLCKIKYVIALSTRGRIRTTANNIPNIYTRKFSLIRGDLARLPGSLPTSSGLSAALHGRNQASARRAPCVFT